MRFLSLNFEERGKTKRGANGRGSQEAYGFLESHRFEALGFIALCQPIMLHSLEREARNLSGGSSGLRVPPCKVLGSSSPPHHTPCQVFPPCAPSPSMHFVLALHCTSCVGFVAVQISMYIIYIINTSLYEGGWVSPAHVFSIAWGFPSAPSLRLTVFFVPFPSPHHPISSTLYI